MTPHKHTLKEILAHGISGGDPSIDPVFPERPADFASLSDDELNEFIAASEEAAAAVHADADSFVNEERSRADLLVEMRDGVAAIEEARQVLANTTAVEPAAVAPEAPAETVEPTDDEFAAELGELAGRAETEEPEGEEPEGEEPEGEEPAPEAAITEPEVEPEPEPVVAAAPAPARPAPMRRPGRSVAARPRPASEELVALTASAPNYGVSVGTDLDLVALGEMMMAARRNFGNIPPGTSGELIPLASSDWSDRYPAERRLTKDEVANMAMIAAAADERVIRAEMDKRRRLSPEEGLVASGGLCAPLTPYYQLMQFATADRPVRAALPSFNADRGGIRYARPASLAAITTGVGYKTAAEDAAGGSEAAKTCQVIDCPQFTETDVAIIFHCLQFGNLGARTFPELLAQWTQLTMAAHARLAETALLDAIELASTAVTASNLGLGASATIPSVLVTAAAGFRSRHRMAQDAVLRVLLPSWVKDLLVSDMYRSQFDRFDMNAAQFVALLRQNNIEPSFYIDGSTAGGQVFGAQGASDLLAFPSTVESFVFPEGSFLFVDGGTLELGLVRDSVLNATNDFQIFGETFENLAFIGVESLALTITTCDSGTVTLPQEVDCPIDYAPVGP